MEGKVHKAVLDKREEYYSQLPENFEALTEYIGWKAPIVVLCRKCGRIHTYTEARDAVRQKCQVCHLRELRWKSTEKLLAILESNNMELVDWPEDSKVAVIRCKVCGDEFSRKVRDVITHKTTKCANCRKIEITNKPQKKYYRGGLTEEEYETRKKQREIDQQCRMKDELDALLKKYATDYDIVSVDKNMQDVTLRHKVCGHVFKTNKARMKKGHGCKICSRRGDSKGVQEIEEYLNENEISYEREKRFEECRRVNPLPFDFFIPSMNLLIEYNGEQHYRATEMFGGEKKLKLYQERDKIKRKFAKENGYRILIIPWYKDPIPMLNREINRE